MSLILAEDFNGFCSIGIVLGKKKTVGRVAQLLSQSFFRFHDSYCVRACVRVCYFFIVHIPMAYIYQKGCARTTAKKHDIFSYFLHSLCQFHLLSVLKINEKKTEPTKNRERQRKKTGIAIETFHLSLKSFKQKSMKITHTRLCFKRKFHPSNMANTLCSSTNAAATVAAVASIIYIFLRFVFVEKNSNFVIEWTVCMKAIWIKLNAIRAEKSGWIANPPMDLQLNNNPERFGPFNGLYITFSSAYSQGISSEIYSWQIDWFRCNFWSEWPRILWHTWIILWQITTP